MDDDTSMKSDHAKSLPPPPPLPSTIIQEFTSTISVGTAEERTDSGITHTIPNNSVVTITRHTVITTGSPPPTTSNAKPTSSLPLNATSSNFASSPAQGSPLGGSSPSDGTSPGSSAGVIIGAAVGGVILLVFLIVLWFFCKKQRQKTRDAVNDEAQETNSQHHSEEKHIPQPASAQTTGTQAPSDPFAPFGGKIPTVAND